MKVRARFVELWSRYIGVGDKDGVYLNGENNLYPNELDRVIHNSATARRASRMLAKFIAGEGLILPDGSTDLIVNDKKRLYLTDVVKRAADSLARQDGVFIHVTYGFDEEGNIVPKSPSILNYSMCRIHKEDDEGNQGRIIYKDFEKKKKMFGKRVEPKWFYPFNPNPDVILAQMRNDTPDKPIEEQIRNYRGQVYHLNLTPEFIYASSKFESVYNDCDTEYRMSLYSNGITREGFLGKVAVLTNGLDDEQAEEIQANLQKWLGAENASHLFHLDLQDAEDLDKVLKIINIPSQYDDDQFTNLDHRIRRNIMGAANNIPNVLVDSGDGALFGASGDAYAASKEIYNEQTQSERKALERAFRDIGFHFSIKELGTKKTEDGSING